MRLWWGLWFLLSSDYNITSTSLELVAVKCWVNKGASCQNPLLSPVSLICLLYRSSHWRCYVKQGVLKNFANFTGKHLYWSLFLRKLQALLLVTIKKRLQHKCFNVKFAKFLRTPILKNICEWLLLSVLHYFVIIASFLNKS